MNRSIIQLNYCIKKIKIALNASNRNISNILASNRNRIVFVFQNEKQILSNFENRYIINASSNI